MSKSTYLLFLIAGILISCGEENNKAPEVNTYLVSAEKINTLPLADLETLAQLSGQTFISDLIKYPVSTWKVVYNTEYQGSNIRASGLIYVPENPTTASPVISLQHGTTFLKEDAPSVSGEFTGMEYFASAGYLALMPDFIGYGSSSEIFHPYYDKETSSMAVIDFIKASKEFFEKEKIESNDQLFLAGYSEGGYVTLAAAQEMETNVTHNLTVDAVAAGAGGYDMEQMLESITSNDYYAYPSYLAFVLMSYNNTYEWNKPLTYFFQDKYAQALNTYMTGEYDGWQINSKLTTSISSLLNPEFLDGLKTEGEETELKAALRSNSVSGWKTNLPIQLYHGTEDEIIPFQNSEVTYANFQQAGSTDVTLTLIDGGTHGNSFIPMLKQFVPWFESLRK